ncbi:MAG: hypothetical protein WAK20_08210 [Candidatus Acidiferrum sp.]
MRRPSHLLLPLPFLILASHVSPARQSATAPQIASPVPLEKLYKAFVGNWTGELEYRDYQSDQHVKLPTWLDVTLSPDSRGLQFHYLYDDGPNKVVEEVSAITIDPQISMFTVSSDRERSKETYQLSGFDKLSVTGTGTLQLTGYGTENDKKVDVRITIRIGRNFYRYQKETRLPGTDFQFRDGYSFTRREPPESTH